LFKRCSRRANLTKTVRGVWRMKARLDPEAKERSMRKKMRPNIGKKKQKISITEADKGRRIAIAIMTPFLCVLKNLSK